MSQTNRTVHRASVAIAAAALVLLLAGCAPFNGFLHSQFPDFFGPQRGDDGRVATATEAHATWLELGDCFSFASDDRRAEVVIVPCSDEHVFEVIGQGFVTTAKAAEAGGLQNAVSAECAAPFEAFKANAPAGTRPDQEFLVTEGRDGERVVQDYLCIAALTKL